MLLLLAGSLPAINKCRRCQQPPLDHFHIPHLSLLPCLACSCHSPTKSTSLLRPMPCQSAPISFLLTQPSISNSYSPMSRSLSRSTSFYLCLSRKVFTARASERIPNPMRPWFPIETSLCVGIVKSRPGTAVR